MKNAGTVDPANRHGEPRANESVILRIVCIKDLDEFPNRQFLVVPAMILRIQNASKWLLAGWLALSILAAGSLVHLPDLHAQLHCDSHHSHCHAGDSDHDHDHNLPDDHQCLVELLAAGGADAPVVADFVPVQFVAISEIALLDQDQFIPGISSAVVPGRAPPVC